MNAHCRSPYRVTLGSPLWPSGHPGASPSLRERWWGWTWGPRKCGGTRDPETTPSPGRAGRGLTQMGLPIPRDAPAGRPDPAPWGHGCPPCSRRVWDALRRGLAPFSLQQEKGARPAAGQGAAGKRVPWPLCSPVGTGEGLGVARKGEERRESPRRRETSWRVVWRGRWPNPWLAAGPGRRALQRRATDCLARLCLLCVGFAESADLLSPRARLRGDRKEVAAQPRALLPHLPFPGHRSHQICRLCAQGRALPGHSRPGYRRHQGEG